MLFVFLVKWYCRQCQVTTSDRRAFCKNCKTRLFWTCFVSGRSGFTNNYSRHWKNCNYCEELRRNRQPKKKEKKMGKSSTLEELHTLNVGK